VLTAAIRGLCWLCVLTVPAATAGQPVHVPYFPWLSACTAALLLFLYICNIETHSRLHNIAASFECLQTTSAAPTQRPHAMAHPQMRHQLSACWLLHGSMQRSCLGSGSLPTGTTPGSAALGQLAWQVHQGCRAAACSGCTSRRPGECVRRHAHALLI
jgi:hypothetical protein